MTKMTDHLGNEFESITAMCKYYNVSVKAYSSRIARGHSLQEALKAGNLKAKPTVGLTGKQYHSVSAMVEAEGLVNVKLFSCRISKGWSLHDALLTPSRKKNRIKEGVNYDHKGNKFATLDGMLKYYNIELKTFKDRIYNDWSLEEALTTKIGIKRDKKEWKDHKGKVFDTRKEMAEYWGLSDEVVRSRFKLGWAVEKVLTEPTKKVIYDGVKDHLGNEYPSLKAMCRHYGISHQVFKQREKAGYSLEKILTKKLEGKVDVEDWQGNKYESLAQFKRSLDISQATLYRLRNKGWSYKKISKYANIYRGKERVIFEGYSVLISDLIYETDEDLYCGCKCEVCNTKGIWNLEDMMRHKISCRGYNIDTMRTIVEEGMTI